MRPPLKIHGSTAKLLRFAIVGLIITFLISCSTYPVSKENYRKVRTGMTPKQVSELLGTKPLRVLYRGPCQDNATNSDTTLGVKGWQRPGCYMTASWGRGYIVVFNGGKVVPSARRDVF